MNILGISCFYHDSAAALVREGEIIAAAQEERFSRKKHDFSFPANAINWCLKDAGINVQALDFVVFYDKPFIKFERILETSLASAPRGVSQFIQAMPLWLKQKLWTPDIIRKELGFGGKILFFEHHLSHAASAFYASPFTEAAVLTTDGVGEFDTASMGVGRGNDIRIIQSLKFPHSLGLLYSTFTYYAGFKVNSGEYKLMGLAPYGEPLYAELILKELVDLKDDGSFKLNMKYFGFCDSLRMINRRFQKLFGAPARKPETKITQKYMDVAASIQKVAEEIVLRMARHLHQLTGRDRLCLAGGVALNCVANGRILREGPFKEVWVQPAAGDAGGALGAALLAWYKYAGNKRTSDGINDAQKSSLLGPAYHDAEIESFLAEVGAPYEKLEYSRIPEVAAGLVADGKVIGWFQGRMEFGPRALGARSIIGDARNSQMQSRMNLKIKFRESFRPFAPSVLLEKAPEWFQLDKENPYMLVAAPLRQNKRIKEDDGVKAAGFDKLKIRRSPVPAITHVDYSARVQTVQRRDNPLYYDMINTFYQKTGCPMIINTSFNVRGEPLVCSPQDAFRCFMRTDMDYLVMGSFLLDKSAQKPAAHDDGWQKEFELD